MNKFILIHHRSPESEEALVERVVRFGLKCVPFLGRRVHLHRLAEGRGLLFSVEAGDPVGAGGYVEIGAEGGLAFDGLPMERGRLLERKPTWAAHLARMLKERGAEGMHGRLLGNYALAAMDERGAVTAFGDFTGLKPLFYIETPEAVAVSNRQTLLDAICAGGDRPSYDLLALSWLPGQANIFGERMVHQGVKLLLPGRCLSVDGEGRLKIEAFERQFWHPDGGEYGPLGEEHFDRAAKALDESMAPLKDLEVGELRLSMTGGKDSRVNLAGAMRVGLTDRARVFTRGPEESPEIECAAAVCEAVGVNHHAVVTARADFDLERVWNRLRLHQHLYEGSVCPWDGMADPARSTIVEIHGFVGELFRRTHVKPLREVDIQTLEDARRVFENYHQPFDPLGVLRPHAAEFQRRWFEEWIDRRLDEGVPLNDLPEVFYVENRLALWSGIVSSNSVALVRIMPMAHPEIAAIGYRGGYPDRRDERMHFELIRRGDRRLVEAPFLKDVWSARLKRHFGELRPAAEPFVSRVKATTQNLVSWQWEFLETAREEILALLLDSPNSGLYEICDPERVRGLAENWGKIRSVPEAKAVISLIGMQLLLTGGWTAAKESLLAAGERGELHTNIEGVRLETSAEGQRLIEAGGAAGPIDREAAFDHPSVALARRLRGGSKTKLAKLTFELPSETIRRVRFDPTNAPGEIVIGGIELEVDGEKRAIDIHDPKALKANRWIEAEGARNGTRLFRSIGRDPHLTVVALAGVDLSGAKRARLHVEMSASAGSRAECFWDLGEGYSEKRKCMVRLAAEARDGIGWKSERRTDD
jgi:hypothetical protein